MLRHFSTGVSSLRQEDDGTVAGRHSLETHSGPEAAFEGITKAAAQICQVPIAFIGVLDERRLWFKSRVGLTIEGVSIDATIRAFTLRQAGLLVIPDASQDMCFSDLPAVAGPPHLRFYASAPLVTSEGEAFGTLCVCDTKPRSEGLTPDQAEALLGLSKSVTHLLELRQENGTIAAREKHWRDIAEAIPHMVWSARADGSECYYSARWHDFTGMAPMTSAGDVWSEAAHPGDRQRVLATWQHSIETGEAYEAEYRLLHHGGEYRWVQARAMPVYDDQGRIERWLGTSTDTHAAKAAEVALARREEQYGALLKASAVVLWVATADGRITQTQGWDEITGQAESEAAGLGSVDVIHPEDADRIRQSWLEAAASGDAYEAECRVLHRNGEYRWMQTRAVPIRNPDGSIREWVGGLSDIHERKLAEEQLRASEERLRLALQAARMTAWELDLATQEITSTANSIEVLGYSPNSLRSLLERTHPDDAHKQEVFLREIEERGSSRIDGRVVLPNGHVQWLGIRGEKRGPQRIVGVAFDISESKAAEAAIWRSANHDPLTGLPNRVLFQQRLEEALAQARRNDTSVSLLMLDLDDFKVVNDLLGHDAGDAVLREVAARLRSMTRDCDTVARFGGDEFGIILVEPLRLEHTIRYAERAIKRLRKPFLYAGRKLVTRTSIGVSAFPDHSADLVELMKASDIALYRAKALGRNRAAVYTPEMGCEIEQQAALRQDVRKALSKGQFVPYYQPKIDLLTQKIVGFEALARWLHPSRGILLPDVFGSVFDDLDLGSALGQQMLAKVVADMRQWLDSGVDFGAIAVNISSAEFSRSDLAGEILGILEASDVPPHRLEIEVTETVLLGKTAADAGTILRQLSDAGVQIALDDFGTGYGSLTHLKQFPVNHVKIDRSFVRDLEEDADDAAIIAAVIKLGQSLNLTVTAEGVEAPGQAQRLGALGCHNAQGFLYSKPITASQVPGFLRGWSCDDMFRGLHSRK